jgi:hypothetical protein
VRVPARREDGGEAEVDLTIRVFQRPDGTRIAMAGLVAAALGETPAHLQKLEDALLAREYEVV